MAGTGDSLILELLEWLSRGRRPYGEVLEGWRTSCPRLPVWEEACRLPVLRDQAVARSMGPPCVHRDQP